MNHGNPIQSRRADILSEEKRPAWEPSASKRTADPRTQGSASISVNDKNTAALLPAAAENSR